MRRLIINADDLGINPQRSHGIFQCAEFGVVTSVSVIPNCSDSSVSAKHARERGVSAGLHLNLTEEYPLSDRDDIASLLEGNGQFLAREKLIKAIKDGAIEAKHVEREVRAQFEWFMDGYGMPTHVSGHEHIHIEPVVLEALIPLLERYGISRVRIPCEEPLPPFGFDVPEERLRDIALLNERAKAARNSYAAHGVSSTDHFRGETILGNASLKNLRHILNKLPEGTTELMVHPSSDITYGTPFDLDPQRQTELRMLLDESVKGLLAEKKIELVSWADA